MAFNTEKFRKSFGSHVQPNHYTVEFIGKPNLPNFTPEQNAIFDSGVGMRCFSTQLPGLILDTIERRYSGPYRLIPVGFVYQQVPIMLYENENFEVRGLFDSWMYGIAENRDLFVRYYDDIIAHEMRVHLFNRYPNILDGEATPVKTYIFEEVYPLSVGAVQLDWSANNTILGVNVEIQYHRWSVINHQNNAGARDNTVPYKAPLQSNTLPVGAPIVEGGVVDWKRGLGK